MLFSRKDIAQFINGSFEPVWESVRPVPIVRIDFGNGTTLTRTLHGNIATSVCNAEGQVLDILPGVYEPQGYLAALDQLRMLPQYIKAAPLDKRTVRLREYHETHAKALAKEDTAARLIDVSKMSKAAIESSIKLIVHSAVHPGDAETGTVGKGAPAMNADDLAGWKLLAEDTRINESKRRLLIHEKLANAGAVQPVAVTKWMYKDVLNADLDDPYLGLGKVLFAGYPFAKEDSQ